MDGDTSPAKTGMFWLDLSVKRDDSDQESKPHPGRHLPTGHKLLVTFLFLFDRKVTRSRHRRETILKT